MRSLWLLTLLALGSGLAARADSTPMFFFNDQVDIVFGQAQLFSPTNVLLSTATFLAADGGGFSSGDQLSGTPNFTLSATQAAFLQSQVDQSAVQQIQNDSNVPSRFSTGLQNLIDANGIGGPDPFTTVSNALFNQPSNFTLTSDTGFVAFGQPFEFEYITILKDFPLTGDETDGLTNVSLFERDVQFTEVPEPASATLIPLLLLLATLLLSHTPWWPTVNCGPQHQDGSQHHGGPRHTVIL